MQQHTTPAGIGRFLIIDGSSMLSTHYYATLPRDGSNILRGPDGEPTNAVFPMLRQILEILDKHPEITHMAVVFDRTRNTFRRREYAEYKANRTETPSDLAKQFAIMDDVLKRIGILSVSSTEYEADDLAGTIATIFKERAQRVTLVTKDRDYLQLITTESESGRGIDLWMPQIPASKASDIMTRRNLPDAKAMGLPSGMAYFDAETCRNETGLDPVQTISLKAIAGDKSDNIPGAAGIGDKIATQLLQEFGSVEGIYGYIETEGQSAADARLKELKIRCKSEKILNQKDSVMLSKRLATIKIDVPGLPDDESCYVAAIDAGSLRSVIAKYGMASLEKYL